MAVNCPTDGWRELNRNQGENIACRYMITPLWICGAYKLCELKYLQDEYKKHKTYVNVKHKE
jgi:hypothetical protein